MTASTLAKTAAELEEHTEILRDPTYYSRGPGPDVMDAASLIDDPVMNSAGEHLGKIEAIMLDVRAGRVAYAVLSFGGFLGIHDKLFAIPWSALTLDAVHRRFVLDIDKKRLEGAPGFDKAHWPSMADPAWGAEVHAYYETDPYWDDRDDTLSASSG